MISYRKYDKENRSYNIYFEIHMLPRNAVVTYWICLVSGGHTGLKIALLYDSLRNNLDPSAQAGLFLFRDL